MQTVLVSDRAAVRARFLTPCVFRYLRRISFRSHPRAHHFAQCAPLSFSCLAFKKKTHRFIVFQSKWQRDRPAQLKECAEIDSFFVEWECKFTQLLYESCGECGINIVALSTNSFEAVVEFGDESEKNKFKEVLQMAISRQFEFNRSAHPVQLQIITYSLGGLDKEGKQICSHWKTTTAHWKSARDEEKWKPARLEIAARLKRAESTKFDRWYGKMVWEHCFAGPGLLGVQNVVSSRSLTRDLCPRLGQFDVNGCFSEVNKCGNCILGSLCFVTGVSVPSRSTTEVKGELSFFDAMELFIEHELFKTGSGENRLRLRFVQEEVASLKGKSFLIYFPSEKHCLAWKHEQGDPTGSIFSSNVIYDGKPEDVIAGLKYLQSHDQVRFLEVECGDPLGLQLDDVAELLAEKAATIFEQEPDAEINLFAGTTMNSEAVIKYPYDVCPLCNIGNLTAYSPQYPYTVSYCYILTCSGYAKCQIERKRCTKHSCRKKVIGNFIWEGEYKAGNGGRRKINVLNFSQLEQLGVYMYNMNFGFTVKYLQMYVNRLFGGKRRVCGPTIHFEKTDDTSY